MNCFSRIGNSFTAGCGIYVFSEGGYHELRKSVPKKLPVNKQRIFSNGH
jgi:hypothetical protein